MPENSGLPDLRLGPGTRGHAAWDQAPPDPLAEPDLFDGVLPRRVTAYVLDLVLILGLWVALSMAFGVAGILTFGALTPLGLIVLAVLPVGYHTFFIGRDGATPGMRVFDLEVRSWTGRPPDNLPGLPDHRAVLRQHQPDRLAGAAGTAVHRSQSHAPRYPGRHDRAAPHPPARLRILDRTFSAGLRRPPRGG